MTDLIGKVTDVNQTPGVICCRYRRGADKAEYFD